MQPSSIDLIITYVNSSDQNWVRSYIKKTKTHNPTAARFRSWGTLTYLLRGVEKYMPFIRNVVLIVASPSQVPAWVNQENVRIVYHKDFIPEQYLPTFNSCTIESFFWNIPDLADRVIYINDDMFPVDLMSAEDFFTEDIPHIKFTDIETYSSRNVFRCQCRSGIDLLTNVLGVPPIESGKFFKPCHISNAITRQGFEAIKDLCADEIGKTVSTTRLPTNVNQYIYSYYYYFTDNYINDTVSYEYFDLCEDTLSSISDTLLCGGYQMLCLNDSDKLKNYSKFRSQLNSCFEQKFPERSKYER